MLFKILSCLGVFAGIGLAVFNFFTQKYSDLSNIDTSDWVIPAILFFQGIPQLYSLLSKMDISKKSKEEIRSVLREEIQSAYNDNNMFLDGLPETQDPITQKALKLGTAEMKRAQSVQQSQELGAAEIAKQQKAATLKAIEYYRQGLTGDLKTSERCALLNLIGVASYPIGELDNALNCWKEMAELAETMIFSENTETAREGHEALSMASGNMGNVYQIRGDLDLALEMYGKGLEIDKELGRKEGMAAKYGNMGVLFAQKGDTAQAREYLTKALDLFTQIGMKPEIEKVKGLLAGL